MVVQVLLTPTHLAIVMEYAAEGELFERICNAGRFSEDEVVLLTVFFCRTEHNFYPNALFDLQYSFNYSWRSSHSQSICLLQYFLWFQKQFAFYNVLDL